MNNSFLCWLKLCKCWKCHALLFSVVKLRSDNDLDNWRLGHHRLSGMRSEMVESFACGQGKRGLLASSLVVQEVMVCRVR